MPTRNAAFGISLIIPLVIAVLVPVVAGPYVLRVLTLVFMYAALAQGWNILGGFAGYPSFGNVAFFGVGAYATAIAMSEWHLPFLVAIVISVAASVPISLAISPVLRVNGHYFAIATLAVGELLRELIGALNVMGGATGISLPSMGGGVEVLSRFFYFAMLALVVVSTVVVYVVRYSRVGRALLAMSSDETAAQAVGINTVLYRIVALVISGAITAGVGSAYGYWISYIEPPGVFSVLTSVLMIVMVLMGGISTIWGPLIGALVFGALSEVIWSKFLDLHMGILGLAMVLLILFLPKGILDLFAGKRFLIRNAKREARDYQA